MENALAGFLYV